MTEAEKHANEQFELLGRFVQEFEYVLANLRRLCVFFVDEHQEFFNILLYSKSMTAQPLLEATIAIVATALEDKRCHLTADNKQIARDVLKQLSTQFGKLMALRNSLVHGSLYIGWSDNAEIDFAKLKIYKLAPDKNGLSSQQPLPDTNALRASVRDCIEVTNLIFSLLSAFIGSNDGFKTNFTQELIPGTGQTRLTSTVRAHKPDF